MNLTIELSATRRSVGAPESRHVSASAALVDSERQPCEIWTRVMGYHRPVSSFNTGKQAEHEERRFFKAPPCGRR